MSVLSVSREHDDHLRSDNTRASTNSLSSSSSPIMQAEEEECTTEEYLRNIWSALGVGKNGFLEQKDLYCICEHIGMIGINDGLFNNYLRNLTMIWMEK